MLEGVTLANDLDAFQVRTQGRNAVDEEGLIRVVWEHDFIHQTAESETRHNERALGLLVFSENREGRIGLCFSHAGSNGGDPGASSSSSSSTNLRTGGEGLSFFTVKDMSHF